MTRDTDRWDGNAMLPEKKPGLSGDGIQEVPDVADGGTEPVQEDRISFRNEKAAKLNVGPAKEAPPTGQWSFMLESAAASMNGDEEDAPDNAAGGDDAGNSGGQTQEPAGVPAMDAAEEMPGPASVSGPEAAGAAGLEPDSAPASEADRPSRAGAGLQDVFEQENPSVQDAASGEEMPDLAAGGETPAADARPEAFFGGGPGAEAEPEAAAPAGNAGGGLADVFGGDAGTAAGQPGEEAGPAGAFGQDAQPASGTGGGLESFFGEETGPDSGTADVPANKAASGLEDVFGQDGPAEPSREGMDGGSASGGLEAAFGLDVEGGQDGGGQGFSGGTLEGGLEDAFGLGGSGSQNNGLQDQPDGAPDSGLENLFGEDAGSEPAMNGSGGGLENAFGQDAPAQDAAPTAGTPGFADNGGAGGLEGLFGEGGGAQNGGSGAESAAQSGSASGTGAGADAGSGFDDLFGLGNDGAEQSPQGTSAGGAEFGDAFSGDGAAGAFGASIPLGGKDAGEDETVIPGPEAKPDQLGGGDMQAVPRADAEPVHDQVQGDPMSKTRNGMDEAPEAPEAAGFQAPEGDGPAWMMQGASAPSPEALAAEGPGNAVDGGYGAEDDAPDAPDAVQPPVKGQSGMKSKLILLAGGFFALIACGVVAWVLLSGGSKPQPAVRPTAQRPAAAAKAKPEEKAQRPIAPGVEENLRRMTGRGINVLPASSVPGAEKKQPGVAEQMAQEKASRSGAAPASGEAKSRMPANPGAPAAVQAAGPAAVPAASAPALQAGLSRADREKLDSISERLDKAIAILEGMKPEAVDERLRTELENLRKARNDLQESLRAKERMVDELTTENARLKKGAPAPKSGRGQAQKAESRPAPSSSPASGSASLKGWRILGLSNTLAVLEDPEGRIWHAGKGGKAGPLEIRSVDVATGNVETSAGTLKYGQEE